MLNLSSDHQYKQQRQTDIWDFFLLLAQIDASSERFQGTTHFHNIAGFFHFLLVYSSLNNGHGDANTAQNGLGEGEA